MRKLRTGAVLALALVALSLPLAADTAYIPFAANESVGDFTLKTEIWVTNPADVTHGFTAQFLQAGTDGTIRNADPVVRWVGPGESRLISVAPAGARGMVELWGSRLLQFDAFMSSYDASGALVMSVEIPIITSKNLVPAGEEAFVQGWGRDLNGRVSNIGVTNLGHEEITCSILVELQDGTPVTAGSTLILAPLSVWQFDDPFLVLFGRPDVVDGARALFICDQPYWPYGSVFDGSKGTYKLTTPAVTLAMSDLERPTDDVNPPPPPPPPPPPGGTVTFDLPGTYLVSSRNNHNWRFTMPMENGATFSKVVLDFDVFISGWDPRKQDGTHALFWLQLGQSWASQNIGYLNDWGTRNQLTLLTLAGGGGRTARSANTPPGNWYHVNYVYDTVARTSNFAVSNGGGIVSQGGHGGTLSALRPTSAFIEFGTQFAPAGVESTTYGWQFKDFHIEWQP